MKGRMSKLKNISGQTNGDSNRWAEMERLEKEDVKQKCQRKQGGIDRTAKLKGGLREDVRPISTARNKIPESFSQFGEGRKAPYSHNQGSVNAKHDRRMNRRARDGGDEGVNRGRVEITVIVARCAASAPQQDVTLCLMRQQCRQLVPDMTLSVTNK